MAGDSGFLYTYLEDGTNYVATLTFVGVTGTWTPEILVLLATRRGVVERAS